MLTAPGCALSMSLGCKQAPLATMTKADLAIAVRDLKIWTGSVAAAGVAVIATLQHFWK